MARGFRGFRREPSSGKKMCDVLYWVDVNVGYHENVKVGDSVLNPISFTPTKSGYTFLGWKDSGIASADVFTDKVAEGKTMTLYAVFTKAVTVTYYNNSATASTSTKTQYYNNSDILNPTFNLTVASVSGWTARGWSTGSGASATITYNSATNFTRDSNVTLYASWSRTVTVSYNGNGATSGSTSASTGTAYRGYKGNTTNASISIRANGFAKTNYTFYRWRLNSTSGTIYTAGSTYTSTADATMYAYWIVTSTTYNYTGGMQSFTALVGVTYQIQLYGAQGGTVSSITGGKGGYTLGYRKPSKNETWYIGVGGQGATFNGGGVTNSGGNGGGASHISLQNAQIASSSLGNIIGIAGGGGGCGSNWSTVESKPWYGGTGGGTNGGNGTYQRDNYVYYSGFGGSQSAGGSGAYSTYNSSDKGNSGSYGKGGNGKTIDGTLYGGGGGGGLYGGGGGHYMNGVQAGGGGSGSTRALTSASMSNGQKSGNGQVIIKVYSVA